MNKKTRGRRRRRTGREPWGQVLAPDIWRIKVGKYSINDEVRWNKAPVLLSCSAVADFPGAHMASVAHSSITVTMQHLHHSKIFYWADNDAQGKILPYNYSEQVSYTQHHWLCEPSHPLLGKGVFYLVGCLPAPSPVYWVKVAPSILVVTTSNICNRNTQLRITLLASPVRNRCVYRLLHRDPYGSRLRRRELIFSM